MGTWLTLLIPCGLTNGVELWRLAPSSPALGYTCITPIHSYSSGCLLLRSVLDDDRLLQRLQSHYRATRTIQFPCYVMQKQSCHCRSSAASRKRELFLPDSCQYSRVMTVSNGVGNCCDELHSSICRVCGSLADLTTVVDTR